ncbi:Histone acetyltransferase kat2b [Phytophthora pseudosyringae]|uniref:histone acetyltransferase n=1 Tax=Phytophthora pseudosyringae TaxID=221518 RepID=A0A8T1WLB6_9STRA|nr:Histone acetyltransferase kat2b [Phytophthora pseudosyringae]
MASKSADKEAQPVAASATADEVVGASETSSQNSEESTKNSQGTEQEDVEMEEADADARKEDAEVPAEKKIAEEKDEETAGESKTASKGVDTALRAEVKAEDTETKTEDEEPTAHGTSEGDEKEGAAADEKTTEAGDVEMEAAADEASHEAKCASNDAPAEDAGAAARLAESLNKTSEADASAAASSTKEAPAKASKPADDDGAPNELEQADADVKDTNQGWSPKRMEPVRASASETSALANGSVEPAAKKQKLDAAGAKTPEKDTTVTGDGMDAASPSVMISRDDMAKMEEDSGRLKFEVITNDGTDEHMIQLTTLKNIFAKQLPKMPKEYIVRLVFDKNHRSMLLLKNGTHVIGGICYRPFEKNHFAEIAFCAINASDQVKGYGTRLMNHLKEYVKTKNITYFLTYADNYAIGYFKKQGFTKSVSMARPNWYGYIKDYDGGTLMECTIHTQINYLRITSMIHKQRKAIQDKIQERSRAKTVYPGLTQFAEGRLMDIYMVPGVKEAGWSQATIRNNRIGTRDQGSLKSQLSQLLKAVSNHRSAWPFHEPVDTSVVVDYLDHIKEPVDLQLLSKRIDSGVYMSKAALKADLEKMCDNCTIYNTPDTNYYKAAVDLRDFIQSRIQI